jgi:hypothetical protein
MTPAIDAVSRSPIKDNARDDDQISSYRSDAPLFLSHKHTTRTSKSSEEIDLATRTMRSK